MSQAEPHPDPRLETIYKRYAPVIHRRCAAMLGQEEAQDAVQDIFIILQKKLGTFRGEAEIMTWIFRITTNHCLNRLRSRRRLFSFLSNVSPPEEAHHPTETLDQKALLRALLTRLDPKQVQIAYHRHCDGMTQAEIAELMGVTERTIRNQLGRIQSRARDLFETETQ